MKTRTALSEVLTDRLAGPYVMGFSIAVIGGLFSFAPAMVFGIMMVAGALLAAGVVLIAQ